MHIKERNFMESMWEDSKPLFFALLFCGVMVVFCIIGLISSIVYSYDKHQILKVNECKLVESVKTGNKKYCGKACFRPEYKVTYMCRDTTRTFLE